MGTLDIDILKKLGKFTNDIKKETIDIVKENVSFLEVIEFIENKIIDNGYTPAFPCTICVNEQAAHFTVYDEDITFKMGDVVKVDFGVCCEGFLTDTAFTVEVGTDKYKDLLEANKKGLNAAVELVNVGLSMGELGGVVHKIAKEGGFETIHNLSGHQIGHNDLHCGIHVPNYDNRSNDVVECGMELAIEPFFTTGDPLIKEGKPGNILHLNYFKPVRDPITKRVLDYIVDNYPHLPFSKRWLLKKFDKKKVNYAVSILKRNNIILEYNVLVSNNNKVISQFEDTVVFDDNKEKIVITRLEN